jgi:hypothetical protein
VKQICCCVDVAVFFYKLRGCLVPQKFFTPSYRMFGHMYGVLNVDEKLTNCTDCDKIARRIF